MARYHGGKSRYGKLIANVINVVLEYGCRDNGIKLRKELVFKIEKI